MVDTLSDTMHTWYASQLGHDGAIIELEREYFGAATNETWADVALRFYSAANGSSPAGSINDEAWKYYSSRSGLSPAASYSLADHMYAIFGSGSGHAVISPITDNLELFLDAAAPDGYQTDARVSKNMLTANQASAETDTTGFTARGNTTIARNTTQFVHGVACIAATSVAAGGYGVNTTTTLGAVPVLPNTVYTIAVQMKAATVGRTVSVSINWWDSSGAFITGPGTNYTSVTTGWVLGTHTATSPSNAAFASLAIAPTTSGGAGEVHYFDNFGLWLGTSTDWVMPGKLQNINLLTYNQATVETDTTGLVGRTVSSTISRVTTGSPPHGLASVQVACSSSNPTGVSLSTVALGIGNSRPAVAGRTYTAHVSVYAPSITKTISVYLIFLDSAGVQLTFPTISASLSSTWQNLTVSGVAPANTAYVNFTVDCISTAIGETYQVDKMGIWEGYSTTWVPPYRGIGTYGIQDGDPVPFLYDLSGKGRHASQATVASQPLYRKYDVTASKNMLTVTQASAEDGTTTGWGALVAGQTSSSSTDVALHGSRSIKLVRTAVSGTFGIATNTSRPSVISGRTYTVVGWFRPTIAAMTGRFAIEYRNSDGTSTGVFVPGMTSVSLVANAWTFVSQTFVATQSAIVEVSAASPTTYTTADALYIDQVGFWEGSSTTWVEPSYPVRNLLTYNQASIETDTTGFVANTNGTISRITSQSLHGSASLQCASVAAGAVTPGTPNATSGIPVVVGRTYTATVWVKSAVITVNAQVGIYWFNAAGGFLTQSLGTASALSTSAWGSRLVTAVAPTDAAYAAVRISWSAVGASELVYTDQWGIWEGSRTIWQPPVTLGNNKPTIQWAYGQSGSLELLNGIVLPPTATTIYVITKLDATGYSHTPRILAIGGGFFIGLSSAGPFGRPALAWTANPIDNNVPTSFSVLSFKMGASASEIRYNGVLGVGTAAAASGVNTATWDIGSSTLAAGGGVIPGTISAILVYSAAHTDTQRQQIERWLGGRYGVTVA